MKLEHVAINVESPLEMAEWYVRTMGLEIIKQSEGAPFTAFLADNSGRVMIEIYNNPADQVPDYRNMDPLILHLAFVSQDPEKDKERLVKAGAKVVSNDRLDDGSHLIMLRDPWGVCIQLCKRGTPMLAEKEKENDG
jgi:glyoxylase I family protein